MPSLAHGYGDGIDLELDPTLHPEVEGQPQVSHFTPAKKSITDSEIRCQGEVTTPKGSKSCHRLLAEMAGRPWRIQCPRCRFVNNSPPDPARG